MIRQPIPKVQKQSQSQTRSSSIFATSCSVSQGPLTEASIGSRTPYAEARKLDPCCVINLYIVSCRGHSVRLACPRKPCVIRRWDIPYRFIGDCKIPVESSSTPTTTKISAPTLTRRHLSCHIGQQGARRTLAKLSQLQTPNRNTKLPPEQPAHQEPMSA